MRYFHLIIQLLFSSLKQTVKCSNPMRAQREQATKRAKGAAPVVNCISL